MMRFECRSKKLRRNRRGAQCNRASFDKVIVFPASINDRRTRLSIARDASSMRVSALNALNDTSPRNREQRFRAARRGTNRRIGAA
jgi:hypothetical protein